MIIGRDYLLKKPGGPSAPKFFFDTKVIPFAANLAGAIEVSLDRAAARTGVRPAVILAGVVGVGSLLFLGVLRSLNRQPRPGFETFRAKL